MINVQRTALYCASAVAFALAVSSAAFAQSMATDKPMAAVPQKMAGQPKIKVIAENEKLQVIDAVDRPGDTAPIASRLGHVVFWVNGGSLERTYADGSKEVVTHKAGAAILVTEKRPYSVKNIGNTPVHLIEVWLK